MQDIDELGKEKAFYACIYAFDEHYSFFLQKVIYR